MTLSIILLVLNTLWVGIPGAAIKGRHCGDSRFLFAFPGTSNMYSINSFFFKVSDFSLRSHAASEKILY